MESFNKISILMPLKNAEKWIIETIKSIQEQTFTDWEIIIINDHSTDNSEELIAQIQSKDPRIQLLQNQRSGIISALQLGLNLAKGKYITRMDADDIMPQNRLKWMVECIENSPPRTIVTGKVSYFSDHPISEGYLSYQNWLNERIDKKDHFQHIYRECVIASPNWMCRKSDLITDSIFGSLSYPEDYDMTFHWMKHNYSIETINEVTLLWREHPDRTSRNSNRYQQASFFELKAKWFMEFNASIPSVGVVGMGQKGKLLAKLFDEANFPFQLYDLNASTMNQTIRGKQVKPAQEINDEKLLIARYPKDINMIEDFLNKLGYEIGKNAFWV